ncbi:GNAT family N-acetyltransferase [Algoriphagus confluentis]|uniref:GNAT family N-acetyltransferase n=1 Tax=Algoriphagus confluentis TaxID=1697556 RepID=A0ABQ6PQR2_9BACT|nr:GNAT family N-acetyltransferase [Algoriphagus confluentis]
MEIKHQSEGRRGSFFLQMEGQKKAEMVYVMAGPNKMIIEHTEVDEDLQGQGVGLQLLKQLVDWVRKEEIKVIPLCPFAKATFARHAELRDVLN